MTEHTDHPRAYAERDRTVLRAALLLGVGLGGFVDGIVLHQLLQWHNMVSNVFPPVDLVSSKVNMFWDGVFHAALWFVVTAGVALLWHAGRHIPLHGTGRRLVGGGLVGWSLFNLVEGVIDHHILQLHHVREFVTWHAPWDWAFLVASAVIGAVGLLLLRGRRSAALDDSR